MSAVKLICEIIFITISYLFVLLFIYFLQRISPYLYLFKNHQHKYISIYVF